jgi:hypothetical protein
MTRYSYSISGGIAPNVYNALLDCSLGACSSFLLVVQSPDELEPTATAVLTRLQPFAQRTAIEHEWPGTRVPLDGQGVLVHRFRLTAEAVAVLRDAATAFSDWQEPRLPEDPAFLREDGSTWLGTITHEDNVFLELSSAEKQVLVDAIPDLQLRRDDHTVLAVATLRATSLSADQQRFWEERYLDPPSVAHIVQFAEDQGYWLLLFDAHEFRVGESCHPSLAAALQRATREFGLAPSDWQLRTTP